MTDRSAPHGWDHLRGGPHENLSLQERVWVRSGLQNLLGSSLEERLLRASASPGYPDLAKPGRKGGEQRLLGRSPFAFAFPPLIQHKWMLFADVPYERAR